MRLQDLEEGLILDEEKRQEQCVVEISREKAYYLIAFQVALLLGLIIFVIVFAIKILG